MAIVAELKQSTATTLLLGQFLDDTDGKTAETGLTLSQADVLLWKEGGTTLAQKNESTSCTHRSHGLYTCPVDTTDTNTLGVLSVSVIETGALPVRQDYKVITAEEWNAKYSTTGDLPTRGVIDRGTAQSATGTTLVLRSAAVFADDTVIGATLAVYGSTQAYWQTRTVTDYVLSTDTATVDTWTVTPSGTITYVLFAGPPASATLQPTVIVGSIAANAITAAATATDFGAEIADAVWDEALSGHVAGGSAGEALGDGYAVTSGIEDVLAGLLITNGTIGSTGNDATHLHLTGQPFGDDELNDLLLVVLDVSTSEKHARWISDYVNSTALATLSSALPFTPQNATDLYFIWSIRQDVTGGSGLDAAGVRAAVGLASANLDTQLGDLPTNAELATSQAAADDAMLAALAAGVPVASVAANALTASALATDAVTEIASAVVEAEITALKTYNRSANTTASITGPTSGSNALGVTVDAGYDPIATL